MSHGQSCITGAAPPDFPPGWAEYILARRQFLLARGFEPPQPISRFVTGSERGEHEVPTVVLDPSAIRHPGTTLTDSSTRSRASAVKG